MKRENLINILNKYFPQENAFDWDYVGLQIIGKEEINSVLVTLDITLEVLTQAIENDVDMIITHHPILFGEKEDLIKENKYLASKIKLLEQKNINVFTIHTNNDVDKENSISIHQAKVLGFKNLKHHDDIGAISGTLNHEEFNSTVDFVDFIKTKLNITQSVNTNLLNKTKFKKIYVCSGSCGDIIFNHQIQGNLVVVGEMKWHHWVYANEMNIDVLEIGHYSENIFKTIISSILENESNLKILESIEENGYSSI